MLEKQLPPPIERKAEVGLSVKARKCLYPNSRYIKVYLPTKHLAVDEVIVLFMG
jgi:hypothetical protein